QRKDEFLATLAHELRNSLAPSRTSLEILKLAKLEDPLQVRARTILSHRLDTVARLTEDLMDASRIGRGKLELRTERLPLANVLHTAVETVAPMMEQLRHQLELSPPEASVFVDGDSVRLVQVFVNLLDNAGKYTRPGGRISIHAQPCGSG